jgi:putative ABC transport system permease protein
MPAGFRGPEFGWMERQQFWVPFIPDENNRSWGRFLLVLGRLRDGVDLSAADRELKAIAQQRAEEDPEKNRGWTADVVQLHQQITGDLRTPLLVLLGAVALLQLIAVVNVSSLVLARSQERALEFTVRTALGAGKRRLLRQLLAEALALVSIGAPLGILLAIWITRSLTTVLPQSLPRLESIRFDGPVLLFGGGLALATFLAIALVPIGQLVRRSIETRLREYGGRAARTRTSAAIIVAEIALALTLTVSAGLAMRSFLLLTRTELGFTPDNLISMRLTLDRGYDSADQIRVYARRVTEEVGRLPGVQAVSVSSGRPMSQAMPATGIELVGEKLELAPVVTVFVVAPDYFRTLRTPLLEGRAHTAADRSDAPYAYVVSKSIANALSPGQSIVGKRALLALRGGMEGEVVGVVDDVRINGPTQDTRNAIYIAFDQWPRDGITLLVRSALPLAQQADALRAAVWSVDRNIPIQALETMDEVVAEVTAQDRVNMLILGLFSVVAMLLAGTGIYGVLAIEVGRRRRELGIRMSMGAEPSALRRMVLTRALITALIGIVIGCGLALQVTSFMRAMLHGVSPADPRTYVIVGLIMLAIALVAAYLPAQRATRIDPLTAIRAE